MKGWVLLPSHPSLLFQTIPPQSDPVYLLSHQLQAMIICYRQRSSTVNSKGHAKGSRYPSSLSQLQYQVEMQNQLLKHDQLQKPLIVFIESAVGKLGRAEGARKGTGGGGEGRRVQTSRRSCDDEHQEVLVLAS